jgi:hypothetical protein
LAEKLFVARRDADAALRHSDALETTLDVAEAERDELIALVDQLHVEREAMLQQLDEVVARVDDDGDGGDGDDDNARVESDAALQRALALCETTADAARQWEREANAIEQRLTGELNRLAAQCAQLDDVRQRNVELTRGAAALERRLVRVEVDCEGTDCIVCLSTIECVVIRCCCCCGRVETVHELTRAINDRDDATRRLRTALDDLTTAVAARDAALADNSRLKSDVRF